MRSKNYGHIKEIPGYKLVLQTVLKSLIQQMVEQLAEYGGEETVVLTASVANSYFSPLGSKSGLAFLERRTDIKSDFMQFCLKHTSQVEERTPKLYYWNNIRSGPQSVETINVDEDNTTTVHTDNASQTLTEPLGNHGSEGEGKGRVCINRRKKTGHPLDKNCVKDKALGFSYTDTDEGSEGITQQETTRVTKTTQPVSKDKYSVRLTDYVTRGKTTDQVTHYKTAGKTKDQVTNHETLSKVTSVEQKDTGSEVTSASSSDLELVCQTTKALSSEGVEIAKIPRVLVHKIQIPPALQHGTFVVGPDSYVGTDGQISPNQRILESPNQRTLHSSLVQTPQKSLFQTEKEDESVSTWTDSEQNELCYFTERKSPPKSKYPKIACPSSQPQISFSSCRPLPEIHYSSCKPHQFISFNQHKRRAKNSLTHHQPKTVYSGSLHQSKISHSTSHPKHANNSSSNQPPLKISYYFSQSETEISNPVSQPEPKSRSNQSPIVAHSMRLPSSIIGTQGLATDNEPVKVEVTEDNEFTENTVKEFNWNKDYNYTIFTDDSQQKEGCKPPAVSEECSSEHSAMDKIELKEEPVDVITTDNKRSSASVVSVFQKVVGADSLCTLSSSDNSSTHTPLVFDSDLHPVEMEASLNLSAATTLSDSSDLTFPVVKRRTKKRQMAYMSQQPNVNNAEKQQVLAYLNRNKRSPDPDSDLSEYLSGGL